MRDDQLGIDTMGLRDEPDPGEPEPTPWERIQSLLPDLRLVVSASERPNQIDGYSFDVELSAERPDEAPEYIDFTLRVSVEHGHDPDCMPERVLFRVLENIVKNAKCKGLLR